MAALALPIILLNTFGGIVAAVWLAVLGEWYVLVAGLGVMVAGHLFIGIALLPGAIFGLPAAALSIKRRPVLAFPFVFLSVAYTNLLVVVFCAAVFIGCMDRATGSNVWPLAVWAYAVALTPWSFLADHYRKAADNYWSGVTVIFAQVAFVAMAFVAIILRWHLIDAAFLFAAVMSINVLIQAGAATAMTAAEPR